MKFARLKSINIPGKDYSVKYAQKPSDVDINKKESLWGQVDYWSRTIRIYDNGRQDTDVLTCLLHEVIHAIDTELKLKMTHDNIHRRACVLIDTLRRNNMVK